MFKFLSITLLSLIGFLGSIQAEPSHSKVQCSKDLQGCFNKIQKIPGVAELIESILQEGPLKITAKNTNLSNRFGAFWDRDRRMICIALYGGMPESEAISSIIFELHNAAVNSKFDAIDAQVLNGSMNKSRYVESMEYIEYVNSLAAAKIADKGIEMGIIPKGAKLHTYRNFQEHYAAQLKSGHSECFAQCYDSLRY